MSKAYKCDNCGELFGYPIGHRFLQTDDDSYEWRVSVRIERRDLRETLPDICVACVRALGSQLLTLFSVSQTPQEPATEPERK